MHECYSDQCNVICIHDSYHLKRQRYTWYKLDIATPTCMAILVVWLQAIEWPEDATSTVGSRYHTPADTLLTSSIH